MTSRKNAITAFLLAIVFGLGTTNASADGAGKNASWISYGVDTCSKVLSTHVQITIKDYKISGPPAAWTLIGWVSGFATAANSAIGSPRNYYKSMSNIEMLNWVASFCRDNPNKDADYAMRLLATTYTPF